MGYTVNGSASGGSSLPTASGANEIPVSSGAGTTYVATAAAGVRTAILGGTLGTSWSAANYLDFGVGASVGPSGGPGTTYAVVIKRRSAISAYGIFWEYEAPAGAAGWQFGHTDAGLLYTVLRGISGGAVIGFTGADISADTSLHALAFVVAADGLSVRWSFDGAVVQSSAITGTYVAPSSSAQHLIGRHHDAGSPYPADKVGIGHLRQWSTVLSDADLRTVSGSPSTGRLPDPSAGTLVFDWTSACLEPGFAQSYSLATGVVRTATVMGDPRLVRLS